MLKHKTAKPYPLIHPCPISIVATMNNNKPNFTTIGDIAVAGINPPLVMISVNENHLAMKAINDSPIFSINIPSTKLLSQVDYAGMFSGHRIDKSKLFEVEMVDHVPIIIECPINLIVKERERIQVEHRIILVCDVVQSLVNNEYVVDNKLSLINIKSILYGLDNHYYTLGDQIGIGYQEGNKEKK
jgi:flavin reductase (DIM6/NTAB) family NADH-FMN oxidoreductase RutF